MGIQTQETLQSSKTHLHKLIYFDTKKRNKFKMPAQCKNSNCSCSCCKSCTKECCANQACACCSCDGCSCCNGCCAGKLMHGPLSGRKASPGISRPPRGSGGTSSFPWQTPSSPCRFSPRQGRSTPPCPTPFPSDRTSH